MGGFALRTCRVSSLQWLNKTKNLLCFPIYATLKSFFYLLPISRVQLIHHTRQYKSQSLYLIPPRIARGSTHFCLSELNKEMKECMVNGPHDFLMRQGISRPASGAALQLPTDLCSRKTFRSVDLIQLGNIMH